ncbi:unnamed protein product, partial [Ranitomeya imitator]
DRNLTAITEFFLVGFQVSHGLRISLFCFFFLIFCGTICGNLLIITLVSFSKNLRTPMYFFISQLSFCDISLEADIVPKMLHVLLNNGATITYIDCIAQLYFFCALETQKPWDSAKYRTVSLNTTYDRYVAICKPLYYNSIMTDGYCVTLSITCWLFGFLFTLISNISTAKLNFCDGNMIDHVYCDILPLLELACSETFIVHLEIYIIGFTVVLIPTVVIVISYTYIVLQVLRIPSSTGRQKAFSTCGSHLTVVSIFYWTMFSVYAVPAQRQTVTIRKILSLLYTVFTPLVNPLIYSLRNAAIWKAVQEGLHRLMT